MGWFDWLSRRRPRPDFERLIALCDIDANSQPRLQVPKEWLRRRISVASVVASFERERPVARWLGEWQRLVGDMQPTDELWEFSSPQDSWDALAGRAGYVVVRDGGVVNSIVTLES